MIVQIYYTLIKEGRRTIEQVPENLRADVQALMDAENHAS
ncbi:ASCH domain-containing protein [Brevibacillus humidisoli]|nr:CD1375 family protein [Brevibacillus humidisoli]UFJ40108.1 ASCH domain-containing protein [Brevibacillus humidisoli]